MHSKRSIGEASGEGSVRVGGIGLDNERAVVGGAVGAGGTGLYDAEAVAGGDVRLGGMESDDGGWWAAADAI